MARPLRPPPPSSLMAIGTSFFLVLKQPKTDFDNFFSPHNFWTKKALFFGKYCKIFFIFKWQQNKKKSLKKVLFSLMARSLVEEFFLRLPLGQIPDFTQAQCITTPPARPPGKHYRLIISIKQKYNLAVFSTQYVIRTHTYSLK